MKTSKDRRHSGRYTPTTNISRKELIANNIEIQNEYDDWNNYRDGFRDWYRDGKMIKSTKRQYHHIFSDYDSKREKLNRKQELLLKRRRARKNKKL
jgi:hypothetical protein